MEEKTNRLDLKNRIVSTLLVVVIVGILFFAGPANAFAVSLSGLNDDFYMAEGDLVFSATIEIEAGEQVEIEDLTLYLDSEAICVFDALGESSCDNVEIELVSQTSFYGYGYGYGYEEGEFVYNITVGHELLDSGYHDLEVIAVTPARYYSSAERILVFSNDDNLFHHGIFKRVDDLGINLGGTTDSFISFLISKDPITGEEVYGEMGKYIRAEKGDDGDISGTEIRIYYSNSELRDSELEESSLNLKFYDKETGEWIKPSQTGVNEDENYVWAITDHFSEWGIFGAKETSGRGRSKYIEDSNLIPGDYMHVTVYEAIDLDSSEAEEPVSFYHFSSGDFMHVTSYEDIDFGFKGTSYAILEEEGVGFGRDSIAGFSFQAIGDDALNLIVLIFLNLFLVLAIVYVVLRKGN